MLLLFADRVCPGHKHIIVGEVLIKNGLWNNRFNKYVLAKNAKGNFGKAIIKCLVEETAQEKGV